MFPELTGPILRGLAAALGYVALVLLGGRLERVCEPMGPDGPETAKLSSCLPRHAPFYARVIKLALSLIYTYALLVWGWLSPQDIALAPPRPEQLLVLIGLALATPCWLLLSAHHSLDETFPNTPDISWPSAMVTILQGQVGLSVLQGTATPLVGAYWGLFAGLLWHAALVLSGNGRGQGSMIQATRRSGAAIVLSLDWVSTLFVALTSSLWAAAAVRLLSGLGLQAQRMWVLRQAGTESAQMLADDQGKHDQECEHGGGENADALEVT